MANKKPGVLEDLAARLREALEDLERALKPQQPKRAPVPVPVPVRRPQRNTIPYR